MSYYYYGLRISTNNNYNNLNVNWEKPPLLVSIGGTTVFRGSIVQGVMAQNMWNFPLTLTIDLLFHSVVLETLERLLPSQNIIL
jgi:hypothetical protein